MQVSDVIEVFADIWCPFTHVGLRMVADARRRAGRDDVPIVVRSWPLELVNGTPMDASKTVANSGALRDQLVPDMFAGISAENFPSSTLDALDLVATAYQVSVQIGERVSFTLRDALFEHGKDVSDLSVLSAAADDAGITFVPDPRHRAVMADWEDGKRRRVIGSPHFFHGEENAFCPSLRLTRDNDAHLHVSTDADRMRQFLERCFWG